MNNMIKYHNDGYVYDNGGTNEQWETGDWKIIEKWFRPAKSRSKKRIWARYDNTEYLKEFEERVHKVITKNSEKITVVFNGILQLAGQNVVGLIAEKPVRFFLDNNFGKETPNYEYIAEDEDYEINWDIVALLQRLDDLQYRNMLFYTELEFLLEKFCFQKFGLNPITKVAMITVNDRPYLMQYSNFSQPRWEVLSSFYYSMNTATVR